MHGAGHHRLLARLARRIEALVVGDPLDDVTEVSALIDPGETERVKAWIDEAVADGARVVVGGGVDADGVLAPEYTDDGVHLTPAGYAAWLSVLEPDLRRRLGVR